MINIIKNYIDKKIEEREADIKARRNEHIDKMTKVIHEEIPKQVARTVENLIGYAKKGTEQRSSTYNIPYPSQKIIRQVATIVEREYRSQRQEFNKQLNEIKRHKADIPDIVRQVVYEENFIQKIIDEINKKQLKK